MVSIPRVQSQQASAANVQPVVQARGAATGRGLASLGDAVEQAGGAFVHRQNLAAQAQFSAASRRAMLETFNGVGETPGLDDMEGPTYLETAPRALEALDEKIQGYFSALTPQQQAAVTDERFRLQTQAQGRVAQRGAKVAGQIAFAAHKNDMQSRYDATVDAGARAQVDLATGKMDMTDVNREIHGEIGEDGIRYGGADQAIKDFAELNAHMLEGPLSEWIETAQVEYASQAHAFAINQRLEDEDPGGARLYLEAAQDELTPAALRVAVRDVRRANAISDAYAGAQEIMGATGSLLTNNHAKEAEDLGLSEGGGVLKRLVSSLTGLLRLDEDGEPEPDRPSTVTIEGFSTKSAQNAERRRLASEQYGPEGLKAVNELIKQEEKAIEAQYGLQFEQAAILLDDNGGDMEAARAAYPGRFEELFKRKDVKALEDMARGIREGAKAETVARVRRELAFMQHENPDKYSSLNESDWGRILADTIGLDGDKKVYDELRKAQRQFVTGGPGWEADVARRVRAHAKDLKKDAVWEDNLYSFVESNIRNISKEGKLIDPDRVRIAVDNALREDFFLFDESVRNTEALSETTAEEAFERGLFSPSVIAFQRDQLIAAGEEDPSDRDVIESLLSLSLLEGTGVQGVGLPPVPQLPGALTDDDVVEAVLGQLSPAQVAERARSAFNQGAASAQEARENFARDKAALLSRGPVALEQLAERASTTVFGFSLPGRTANIVESIRSGEISDDDVRELIRVSRAVEIEDAAERAAARRDALPTLADDLSGGSPELVEVLNRIEGFLGAGQFNSLFRTPIEEMTPARRKEAEDLIRGFSEQIAASVDS